MGAPSEKNSRVMPRTWLDPMHTPWSVGNGEVEERKRGGAGTPRDAGGFYARHAPPQRIARPWRARMSRPIPLPASLGVSVAPRSLLPSAGRKGLYDLLSRPK